MKTPTLRPILISLIMLFALSCGQKAQTDEIPGDSTKTSGVQKAPVLETLSKNLTFYTSFDKDENADYGQGDRRLYSGEFGGKGEPDSKTAVGLGNPALSVAKAGGRFGGALEFSQQNSHAVFYKLEKNIEYREQDFQGTCSFWLNVDTQDIPGQYCDPIQLTDKYYASDCIWADITKNDVPSDFRLGVFGDRKVWDTAGLEGSSEQFFWRVGKVSNPPFAKGTWTHVAITWEGLNTTGIGRAKLYLNGEIAAQSGPIREPFKWDTSKTTLRLGTGHFVGLYDEVALFNKALTGEEVRQMFNLKNGLHDLPLN